MIIIAAFEEFVQELTVNTSVKREIQILKQLNRLAQAVQKVVVLLLPTITSSDKALVQASSKLHLIAQLGLEDAHLHESFGSARLSKAQDTQ